MMRVADWEPKLRAFLESRFDTPHAWGRRANDCVSCAMGWAHVATGRDPFENVPDYASAEEADLVLDAMGGLYAALDARFERLPSPAFAQRGDIGAAKIPRREAPSLDEDVVVIVEGDTIVAPGRRGLARLPRRLMHMAWRV